MSLINDALKRANQAQPNRPAPPPRTPRLALQPAAESRPGGPRALFFAAGALLVVLLGLGAWFLWNWASPKAKTISVAASASTAPPPEARPRAAGEAAPSSETMPTPPPVAVEIVPKAEARPIRVLRTSRSNTQPVAPKSETVSLPPPVVPQTTVEAKPTVAAPVPAPAVHDIVPPPVPVAPTPKIEIPATPPTPVVASAPPAPPPFPALKLRGIFYRRTNPTALINNETLSDGDMVDDVRVVKIDRESVTVEWRGQQRVLRLP